MLLLAAHYVLDLAAVVRGKGSVGSASEWANAPLQRLYLEAVDILELGYQKSPHNFQMRLLLLRLYNRLGNVPRALDYFEKLHVKHVQLDTLSQLIIPSLTEFGFADAAADMCNHVSHFHARADREMAEYERTAYEHRNFTKIVELAKFHRRLLQSSQRVICDSYLLDYGLRHNLKDPKTYLQHSMVRSLP